jgi:hypothetical protein
VPELLVPDAGERDDLGAFVARAVRLDQATAVRLRQRPSSERPSSEGPSSERASLERVDVWVSTPFDALVTRSVVATVVPADITVSGAELLAALAIVGGERIDPGPSRDLLWRSALPPADGWRVVDELPAALVGELTDRGVALARAHVGPQGTPPASLLDQVVLTVSGSGMDVKIPMRCLFALSGMGFAVDSEVVRVSATDSWLRIDARYGAVVRRRHALLPLLV